MSAGPLDRWHLRSSVTGLRALGALPQDEGQARARQPVGHGAGLLRRNRKDRARGPGTDVAGHLGQVAQPQVSHAVEEGGCSRSPRRRSPSAPAARPRPPARPASRGQLRFGAAGDAPRGRPRLEALGPWRTTTGCRRAWSRSWTAPARGTRPGHWRSDWASGGRATASQPPPALGLRPRAPQAAQRGGAPLPAARGFRRVHTR